MESVQQKVNADIQMTVVGGKMAVPASAGPGVSNVPVIVHKPRYFYNSGVQPSVVEAALARRVCVDKKLNRHVMGRVVWAGSRAGSDSNTPTKCVRRDFVSNSHVSNTLARKGSNQSEKLCNNGCGYSKDVADVSHGVEGVFMRQINDETALSSNVVATNEQGSDQDMSQCGSDSDHPGLNLGPSICGHVGLNLVSQNGQQGLNQVVQEKQEGLNENIPKNNHKKVNTESSDHCERSKVKLIYDTKYCGFEDKFTSSILYANQKGSKGDWEVIDENIHQLWNSQVDFKFGFVPLQKQVLPSSDLCTNNYSGSLLQIHKVRKCGKPNFLQARIPIQSQLKVEAWEEALGGSWDRQLLELIKFGFPLDFNRACDLGQYTGNQ